MSFFAFSNLQVESLDISPEVALADIFSHYSRQTWAMLLDSAGNQHPNARFDILVAEPIATITSKHNSTEIWHCQSGQTVSTNECPIAVLKNYSQQFSDSVAKSAEELPFMVGMLGYFSYDLARRFETLPACDKTAYQSGDLAIGIYSWSIIKDTHKGGFYLCKLDAYPSPSAAEIEALSRGASATEKFALTSSWQSNLTKQQYIRQLDKVEDYLRAGDCYQVNFAQRFSARYQGDEWAAYLTLRDANKAPFSAFLRTPDNVILSLSPERFLSVNNGCVETKPIKGTRPRSLDREQDLQAIDALKNSAKDRAENLMIVDLLRNDLSRNCQPHSVKVPELFTVESFPAVHHLVSQICATLSPEKTPWDLLRDAFPGGSITGAPKVRAMQIIEELEPHKRHIYCGSIGYLGINQDMDTSICIRTLLCEDEHIYCWAGGGVIIDSNAEDEYQESLDKVAKILPTLE